MSEYSLNSSKGKRWLPWFRDIFEEGRNLSSEHPAELLLVLASGKADALSGRFLTPHDDFDSAARTKENAPSGDGPSFWGRLPLSDISLTNSRIIPRPTGDD